METIQLFKVFMAENAAQEVGAVLNSGYIAQGPKVEEFEEAMKPLFAPNPHILSVNSGTSAIHLALHLLKKEDPEHEWPGIQPGDEVLSSALTCTATNWPVMANGMNIKWVDVDPQKVVINMKDLRSKLSPRTKVIMFVHWGGLIADLDEIQSIRDECYARYGFRPYVIEDCAHAMGAQYRGKNLSNHGNLCIFSLQAIKHLTTGDGGILTVPNATLYRRGKLARWFGISREQRSKPGSDFRLEADVAEWGYKFHMNDINASIGLCNIPHLSFILDRCRANASFYYAALQEVPGVQCVRGADGALSSFWLFSLRVLNDQKPLLMQFMTEQNVVVSQVHKRNDLHSCVSEFGAPLPYLDKLEMELLCIPVGWWVTDRDRGRVVQVIKSFFGTSGKL